MACNVKRWAFVGAVSLLIGGCSGSVDGGGTSSTGTSSSSSSGMGGEGGAGGNGAGGSAGNGAGGSAGAGGGMVCGGIAGLTCAETEYCDYPDDICGAVDGQGVCKPRPEACDLVYSPVCACDGNVHSNDCDAAMKGFDVSNLGGCTPPMANLFGCGHFFCDSATEYCQKTNADVPNTPDSYTCAPLPASCAGMQPSCMCIRDPCGAPIAGTCAAAGNGFMVTCPGGCPIHGSKYTSCSAVACTGWSVVCFAAG
ncbi:MAG: hypothetical protein IPM54_00375 [Polyangiaceae bacterium]|nr:hypothetical protein [Polyangiaceae bacterium]